MILFLSSVLCSVPTQGSDDWGKMKAKFLEHFVKRMSKICKQQFWIMSTVFTYADGATFLFENYGAKGGFRSVYKNFEYLHSEDFKLLIFVIYFHSTGSIFQHGARILLKIGTHEEAVQIAKDAFPKDLLEIVYDKITLELPPCSLNNRS